jgi:hypothetical protein
MDASSEPVGRAELVRTRDEARTEIHRGVALIAAVPLVLIAAVVGAFALGGFGAFMAILLAATYLLVGSIAGIGMIVGGVVDHRRYTRQLRELEAVHQLPEARVVVRT